MNARELVSKGVELKGCQWIVTVMGAGYGGATDPVGVLTQRLEEAMRLRQSAPPLQLATLEKALTDNPHRIEALMQALFSDVSPEMLMAVWLIMHGWQIDVLEVNYRRDEGLNIRLRVSDARRPEEWRDVVTRRLGDFTVLRHIGCTSFHDKPVLDGYYALRAKKDDG